MQILKIYISQGSVATRLRCGGIFNDSFILYYKSQNSSYDAYLLSCSKLPGMSVKKCKKRIIWHKNLSFGTEYSNEVTQTIYDYFQNFILSKIRVIP